MLILLPTAFPIQNFLELFFHFNVRCASFFSGCTKLISAVNGESALKDYDTINLVSPQNSESILPSKMISFNCWIILESLWKQSAYDIELTLVIHNLLLAE